MTQPSAVYHRAGGNYCYALNQDTLRISIQTGEDVRSVALVWGDPFTNGIMGADASGWQGCKVQMTDKRPLRDGAVWWSADVKPPFKRCRYFFCITFFCTQGAGEGGERLFCEDGFHPITDIGTLDCVLNAFVFPWMNSADICTVPKWAGEAVWYQIFPARFCRGRRTESGDSFLPWAEPSRPVNNDERYGGNIAGITERLDYIASLGITGVYLTPVNASPSQHKYDTADYLSIDSDFGTKEDMRRLADEAHRRGIKVMLDGVFNHCGRDFFAWQDVLKHRNASRYKDWFLINDMDFDERDWYNAAKGKYYTFAICDGMPKLNTNNSEVRDYICSVCEAWVRDYDIDALRLDVANEVSHVLCRELRTRLKAIKADFYIVGEIWHNALEWLEGDEFDAVMNYPLSNAILRFAQSNDAAQRLEQDINRCLVSYSEQVTRVLLNQLDSHDTMRAVTRLGSRGRTLQCLVLLFCLPGAACIYYGTEVLLEGGYDPDCRRCMPWAGIERGEYDETIDFVRQLIHLRRTLPAMSSYDTRFVCCPCGKRAVHIAKPLETASDGGKLEGAQSLDALFNFGGEDVPFALPPSSEVVLSRGWSGNVLHNDAVLLFKRT